MHHLSLTILLTLNVFSIAQADYDPLLVMERTAEKLPLAVQDNKRKREIPLLVYLPPDKQPAPVVLFSHGLGGSKDNNPYLGSHWSRRGYVVVMMQHQGSDESVWKEVGLLQRMAAMKKAASGANFRLRVQDVPAVLDQLERWNREAGHPLLGRLDLTKVGMSGHSFGANTTQAVSGQKFPLNLSFTDPRIKAAIMMSPNAPDKGLSPKESFGSVKIPWLLMTGTKDVSPIGGATVESRLAVYPALPVGGKYQLVLHNAEHSAFGERSLPGEKQQRNPNHHRLILASSTAFWDAMLRSDTAAKGWLDGSGIQKLLERQDTWEMK